MIAHRALSRLARERAAADAEEGRWLLSALRSAAHVHLGFASFGEYVERCFGHKPRSTQEKLRVAGALEELPVLGRALEQGTLHWSAVRELTRVAAPETERQWLEVARGKSVHQLEEVVAGKSPGDDPTSPSSPSERRHVLRFEVAPETFALFREALAALRRNTGALDDDSALLALARLALVEWRARVGWRPDIVAMAHCDGQHLGYITPRPVNDGTFAEGREPHRRAHVGAGLGTTLDAENDSTHAPVGPQVHAHAEGPSANAHVGGKVSSAPVVGPTLPRAKQTIPPALRRAVFARDHQRCRVPGCRNSTYLDVHHIQLRSEGGRNEADNLVTLCGAHHRAVHRGQLGIQGTSATTVLFRHADGSTYGRVTDPQALDARARTFAALRGLGFREGEVRAVLARLGEEDELATATVEQWLRAALVRLTPRRSRL